MKDVPNYIVAQRQNVFHMYPATAVPSDSTKYEKNQSGYLCTMLPWGYINMPSFMKITSEKSLQIKGWTHMHAHSLSHPFRHTNGETDLILRFPLVRTHGG